MALTRNRSLLLSAACLALATASAAGCSSSGETVSSTDTTTSGAAPGTVARSTATTYVVTDSQVAVSDTIPETTIPDPNVTYPVPPPAAPSTIPASGQNPVLVDCGIVYRAAGWPTTYVPNSEAFTCIQDAFDTGTPARLVDREQTDGEGGAILVTTYDVFGPGRVRVTADAREAADRPKGITVSECTGLTSAFMSITPSGCTVVG